MSTPTSIELQDRFTRVLEAIDVAREASAVRDENETPETKRDASLAWQAVGAAQEDMRSTIRMAATVLDHAHACDKPTPAGLLRENTSLRAEVTRLREQVETLGGNADRPLKAV